LNDPEASDIVLCVISVQNLVFNAEIFPFNVFYKGCEEIMELTKWIERKFEFNFPVGHYPVILERLRGTPVRLQKLVEGIESSILTKRNGSDWSAQEHAGHLADMDELHEKRLNQYIANMNILLPADMSNKKTYLAEHNSKNINEILADFTEARETFIKKTEGLDEYMVSRIAIHPRLNRQMRLIDMMYFICEHDDHHLAIMRMLINKELQNG
jgi:hypothetical protein